MAVPGLFQTGTARYDLPNAGSTRNTVQMSGLTALLQRSSQPRAVLDRRAGDTKTSLQHREHQIHFQPHRPNVLNEKTRVLG